VCVTAVLSEDTALLRANFVPVLVWYFGQTIEDHPALAFDRTTYLPFGSRARTHNTHTTHTHTQHAHSLRCDLRWSVWAEFLLPFLLVSAPETIRTLVLDYFHLLFTEYAPFSLFSFYFILLDNLFYQIYLLCICFQSELSHLYLFTNLFYYFIICGAAASAGG
jgi:hypothetical protein